MTVISLLQSVIIPIFIGIGLQTPVAVADRPVTQQGLSGMRTGTGKGPQRQFQDKSYFMGLLRTKMTELQTEITKISREIEASNEEQSTFLAYDKRVKELAAELTGNIAQLKLLFECIKCAICRISGNTCRLQPSCG